MQIWRVRDHRRRLGRGKKYLGQGSDKAIKQCRGHHDLHFRELLIKYNEYRTGIGLTVGKI